MSSSAVADRGDRLVGCGAGRSRCVRITVSGVRSSWLAFAGELALAPQGGLAAVDRAPDRHERPAGVDPPGRDREGQGAEAAEDEHGEERGEEPLLRDAFADHLDDPLAVVRRGTARE